MLTENLDRLSLPELVKLLQDTTIELMNLMNNNSSDGILIRDRRIELQEIQDAIRRLKKSNFKN